MTVSTTDTREVKSGNGTTKTFPIGFEFLDAADLEVTKVNTDGSTVLWTLNGEYTISGGGGSTGSLTTTQGNTLASGERLAIRRITERTQDLDLVSNDVLPAEDLESRHDRTVFVVQEVAETAGRAVKAPVSDPAGVDLTVPGKNARQDKMLGFDASGNPIVKIPEDVLSDTDDLPEGGNNLYYTAERARDDIGAALVAGNNLSKTVNDAGDTITLSVQISNTGDVPEGSNLYFTDERAQDAAAAMLTGGQGVSATYDDGNDTLTVSAVLDSDGGLTANSGALAVDPGTGIRTDSNGTHVEFGSGLKSVSGSLVVDAGAGLTVAGGDVAIGSGDGITVNAGSIEVNAGAGLVFNSGALAVGSGDGITVNAGTVAVDPGDGLTFSSGSVAVAGNVARTNQNNVFESGTNGGQQTIKGSFPNVFLFEDDSADANARLEVRDNGVYAVRSVQDDGGSGVTTRWSTDLNTGLHDAKGSRVSNVGTPTGGSDAATMDYVDARTGANVQTITASANQTINLDNGRWIDVTLQANVGFAFSNAKTPDSILLTVRQDSTGGRSLGNFFETVYWPHGTMPEVTKDANAIDVFQLWTLDGGTVWFANLVSADAK